ncbi:uncharacterized protein LOC129807583 [Phlebotomus papatasi]|uniref:uncharacterized protein LOC129807583 n=1 Tax=Phlebotomus papatasi TaxID=29031 RepID=UPI002483919A|nr:uncharacterized protein LOC129807583 [Phlebotomus papatasi]
MALPQRKIQLFAKIDGENGDKDTFCQINSDTFEINDFEKEPIVCKLYVSASKKIHESISGQQSRPLKSAGDYDCLMQKIEKLNSKLDNIHKEISEKKSNVNVHGQTIWITGVEGLNNLNLGHIQTESRPVQENFSTNVTEIKEYGISFTQKPEETLQSHGLDYLNETYDKRAMIKSDDYLKSSSAGRLSVNKNDLEQMKITDSSAFIKKECGDIELGVDEMQKISISCETMSKIKSGPPEELYYSDRRSSIPTVEPVELNKMHHDDRKSTMTINSFCTN